MKCAEARAAGIEPESAIFTERICAPPASSRSVAPHAGAGAAADDRARGVRADPQSVEPRAQLRRFERRRVVGRRLGHRAGRARERWRRLDPRFRPACAGLVGLKPTRGRCFVRSRRGRTLERLLVRVRRLAHGARFGGPARRRRRPDARRSLLRAAAAPSPSRRRGRAIRGRRCGSARCSGRRGGVAVASRLQRAAVARARGAGRTRSPRRGVAHPDALADPERSRLRDEWSRSNVARALDAGRREARARRSARTTSSR